MPKSDRSIILFTVVCVVSLAAILLACILLRSVKKRVLLIMERLPHRGQP